MARSTRNNGRDKPHAVPLQEHALPTVALGSVVARVREGLTNCNKDTAPLPTRLPLPAPVAYAILKLGEKLLQKADWNLQAPHICVLRAAIATISSYVFFNRGECSSCALAKDRVVSSTHITMLLRHEKGKKGLLAGYMNVRQITSQGGAPNYGCAARLLQGAAIDGMPPR